MADPSNFRVVIVGGGPNGLYMAHCLAAAGIDYVVLEQQSSVILHQGALILLYPQSSRLMHQIGLYDKLTACAFPAFKKHDMRAAGQTLVSYSMWQIMEDHSGYATLPMPRSELLRVMYEDLPDREQRVRCNAEVVDIETDSDGVRVHLKDGTIESGSIVIGADGVYSKTREVMLRKRAEDLGQTEEDPMLATFYGIYARVPNPGNVRGVEPGIFFESHATDMASQCMASDELIQFALYKRLSTPTRGKVRHSRQDMEAFAETFRNTTMSPGVKFADLWAHADKDTARLVNQEEGYLENWHHGRIVLLGDSSCKSTSIIGLGYNVGMHSAALLASLLYKLVVLGEVEGGGGGDGATTTTSGHAQQLLPDEGALGKIFARYQKLRRFESRSIYESSRDAVRAATWSSWSAWFVDRFVKPWIDMEDMTRKRMFKLVMAGQVLSYVPFVDKEAPGKWHRVPKEEAEPARAVL